MALKDLGSRGFVTDGAARGEAKLAWAIPSRDGGRQLVNPRVLYTADYKSAQTFRTDYKSVRTRIPV